MKPELLQAIAAKGYTEPTAIQRQAIPLILQGRDVIGSAQTGTGKTAAYALPTLQRLGVHRHTRCLVLTPTRELAIQVEEQFVTYGRNTGLQATVVYGGVGYGLQKQQLRDGADVVVATPGRLIDLLQQRCLSLNKIEVLILDEVDRMLDMGFIEDVQKIVRMCPTHRQTLLFSATIPDAVKRLAKWALRDPVEVAINIGITAADTVDHSVWPVNSMQKFTLLVKLLEQTDFKSVLIFTRTRMGADQITRWLKEHKHDVQAMHSDLPQKERQRALESFKKGEIQILIATDIASRGLDIAGVSHVINYDVPQHPEDYVHRIGRTGRARQEGEAFTLVGSDEVAELHKIERFIGQAIPRRRLEDFEYRSSPLAEAVPVVRKKRNRGFVRREGF